MGAVYRAMQAFSVGIEREVAVKLIHPALLLDEPQQAQQRFEAEIGMLASLEHQGIARIYDGGVDRCAERGDETLYIAMELVRGAPLTEHVAAHRAELGIAGILRLFLRVCDAVAYAHRRGVVHRDLKPANILVDQQRRAARARLRARRALDRRRSAGRARPSDRRHAALHEPGATRRCARDAGHGRVCARRDPARAAGGSACTSRGLDRARRRLDVRPVCARSADPSWRASSAARSQPESPTARHRSPSSRKRCRAVWTCSTCARTSCSWRGAA